MGVSRGGGGGRKKKARTINKGTNFPTQFWKFWGNQCIKSRLHDLYLIESVAKKTEKYAPQGIKI